MKRRIWIASALLALLTVSACSLRTEPSQSQEAIHFTASVGQYTKVLNNAFEEADAVGLFVGAPLNLNNVRLTWDGENLVPETTLYWAEGQQEKSVFRAYYPYNEDLAELTGTLVFPVNADQSTHKQYSNSDLMVAATEAGPADQGVHLAFNHLLSKLTVKVINQTADPIREAKIYNLFTGSEIDCENMVAGKAVDLADNEPIITPAALTDENGDLYYSAIVPPQNRRFAVVLNLQSGRMVAFMSQAALTAGKQFRGTVTVTEQPLGEEIPFTVTVAEWNDGETLRFSNAQVGDRAGWRINYYPKGASRSVIAMEEKAPGAFVGNLPDYREGDTFSIISANNYYILGCLPALYPQELGRNNDEWPIENNGQCQLRGYEGDLNVWFYPDQGIIKYEPVESDWEYIGEGEYVWGIEPALSSSWGTDRLVPKVFPASVSEDRNHPGVYKFEVPVEGQDKWQTNTFVINAANPDQVYLKKQWFNLYWSYNGWVEDSFYLESVVPENRMTLSEEDAESCTLYGTLKNGVIRHAGLFQRTYDSGDYYYFYASEVQFVLPGYTHQPLINVLVYDMDEWVAGDDGTWYAVIWILPYPEVETYRYLVLPNYLSNEEVREQLRIMREEGTGTYVEFEPGTHYFEVLVPIPADGKYTFLHYAEAPSLGENVWYRTATNHYFYLPNPEEGNDENND